MTELKTLKDMNDFPDLSQWALRQEAIKWVKKLVKEDNAAQAFIMSYFFNLTEEDLK